MTQKENIALHPIASRGTESPVSALEEYFRSAGVTVIQAAFAHSYFIHSASVKAKTPYFPDRARFSRQNYPGATKGQKAVWAGDGREVVIDDNQHAQMAWEGTPVAGLPVEPATPFATYGGTRGTRMRSQQGGTSATCPSGPEC